MDELAIDLSRIKWDDGQPMFNVSIMTQAGNPKIAKKQSKTLRMIEFEYDLNKFMETTNPLEMKAHENKLVDHLVYGTNTSKIEELKRGNFDVAFTSLVPFERLIVKTLNLPTINWISFIPHPFLLALNLQPWTASTILPIVHIDDRILYAFGWLNTFNRVITNGFSNVFNLLVNHVLYPRWRFTHNERALSAFLKIHDDEFIGDGMYGIRDIQQEAPNVV